MVLSTTFYPCRNLVSGHLILHARSAQWNHDERCPICITVFASPREGTGIFATQTVWSFFRFRCTVLPESPHAL
jgi:hypothetical protein